MEIEFATLSLLIGVAFIAGMIDSISGGGGLLALPALLLSGLDPVTALATNKLQGSFGTASATLTYWKKGLLEPNKYKAEVITVFIAACFGVLCVSFLPTQFLKTAIPPVLILIAVYFALSAQLSVDGQNQKPPNTPFTFAIAPAIGFYDGIFGPGTGSFFMLALTSREGMSLLKATARTKLLNFTSNIAALLVFAIGGHMNWITGLAMGLAQFAGAQIGARLAIRNGASLIRPLLVIVCVVMALKLWWG